MYCPNCGAEISDDSKFCMNCGYKLHSDNSQTTYTEQPVQVNNYYVEPQKKKSGCSGCIVAFLAVIGFITILVLLFIIHTFL